MLAPTAAAVDRQLFDADGTWNKPPVGTIAFIQCWGGGGAGGRAGANDGGGRRPFGRNARSRAGVGRRCGVRGRARHPGQWYAECTPSGIRRKDTVEADQRMARRGNECTEPAQEIERRHHAASVLPPPRLADCVDDHPFRRDREALEAERCSCAVADEPRPSFWVAGRDGNAGVDAESTEVGRMR